MSVERVTPGDPRLDPYLGLTDIALRRRSEAENGLYIAEGAKVIDRALRARHRPLSVLVSERWLNSVVAIVEPEVPVLVASEKLLEGVTGFHVHRGALAAMERPAMPALTDVLRDARRVIVLEGIVDHTNVGAIFRSVAGLGADAIVVSPTCADPLYRRAVKVSMGTVFQVPWTRAEQWPGALDVMRDAGFTVAALALTPEAVPLDEFVARGHERVVVMVGAEGDGLSREAMAAADAVVTIPMSHGVDSLNVGAATAVALWALH